MRLLLLNLGGGVARVACMSIYSQPSRFTFCIAENEEDSPWESLAASRGYREDEDVITAVMVENPHIIFNDVDRDPSACSSPTWTTWRRWVRGPSG